MFDFSRSQAASPHRYCETDSAPRLQNWFGYATGCWFGFGGTGPQDLVFLNWHI